MQIIKISSNQQVTLSAVFCDLAGVDITTLDPLNPPRWTEDKKGTVVELADGGPICVVRGVAPGTVDVVCLDPGSGKTELIQIVVLPDGVATVSIDVGAIEPTNLVVTPPAEFTVPVGTTAPASTS